MPEGEHNAAVEQRLGEIAELLRQLVAKERPGPRRLFRLSEAAAYLHVSPWQLRGIVQRGELAIVKPTEHNHGPWLIDVRDLDSWIERSKATL